MPNHTSVSPGSKCLDVEIPTQLRKRRAASWRLPVLNDCEHRDPLDCLADSVRDIVPGARFGLSDTALRAHANSLYAAGWSADEIRTVLGIRPKRTAA